MKILLTHSTGFLGSYLLEELSRQDLKIKAATRPERPIEELESDFLIDGLDLSSLQLDMTDFQQVLEAVHDVKIIFHLDHWEVSQESNPKKRLLRDQQVWQNLAQACRRFPVEKIIVLGQAGSLSLSEQGYLQAQSQQAKSPRPQRPLKNLLESHWQQDLQAGLPIIRVYPASLVGPREKGSTALGIYLKKILHNRRAPYVDSGLSLISAEAAAKGLLLAAKRGQVGQAYPLVQENLYFLEFLQKLEQVLNIPLKKTGLPYWLAGLKGSFEKTFLKELQRGLMMEKQQSTALGLPQSHIWQKLKEQIAEY